MNEVPVRHRRTHASGSPPADELKTAAASAGQASESEEDDIIGQPNLEAAGDQLPQSSDKTTEVLDSALKDINPRWRNWIIRGIFTWVMIFGFAFIIYLGPLALVTVVFALQIKCFHEIITIGCIVYRSYNLPWFRVLSWYFLFASNFFFFGESMIEYFGLLLSRTDVLRPFATYHRFISFSLYVAGFVGFVFSLVKKHYLKQFTLLSYGLVQYDYFVCPVRYDEEKDHISMECERSPAFVLTEYNWPETVRTILLLFGFPGTLKMYPFVLHSISMSIFASVIGPFGGFFASGFKRAFKIKDFGDTIPGHGGIMDRFDCQFLMATFVHVYHSSFIRVPDPQKLLQNILTLQAEDQLVLFNLLHDRLVTRGLLPNSTST
ncbi:hypothetical protein C0Q70_00356 [Pomacea canaliculata]|uniref:Phosphatidate cytidylyltransferase n=1 Tax=Pomacea canaliculata TaxID=400727 RepID=A0A2T7PWE0_POMCA|nr:hypothetical protein C0Q70_00356 [Pomacea canaliculata]